MSLFLLLFLASVCFMGLVGHTTDISVSVRIIRGRGNLRWWWDFFNKINDLFVCYDDVSSVKMVTLHIGPFLGSIRWSECASMSKQRRITWVMSWCFLEQCEVSQSAPFRTTIYLLNNNSVNLVLINMQDYYII